MRWIRDLSQTIGLLKVSGKLAVIFNFINKYIGPHRFPAGMHFLQDLGAQRRRNLQIKKRVVLSPTKDDKGDYLESGRGEPDDSKRLKRVFFETFLQNSQKNTVKHGAPEVLHHSIFDNRDDSPTEKI